MNPAAIANTNPGPSREPPDNRDAAEIRDLRQRNEELERQLNALERLNRGLSLELEARRARDNAWTAPVPRAESVGLRRVAGALSHTFNNLMTCIGCSADFLKSKLPAVRECQEHLEIIDQATRGGAEICQRLMIASGEAPLHASELDFNSVVRQAVAAFLRHKVQLRLRIEQQPLILAGDVKLLRQLAFELTANAMEAVGKRSGRISISTGRAVMPERSADSTKQSWIYLEVADDGPGMSSDEVAKIFDPFYSTKFLGRGLGLTVAYSIAEMHRGRISVNSQPGEGSTFRVLLPAAKDPARRKGKSVPDRS